MPQKFTTVNWGTSPQGHCKVHRSRPGDEAHYEYDNIFLGGFFLILIIHAAILFLIEQGSIFVNVTTCSVYAEHLLTLLDKSNNGIWTEMVDCRGFSDVFHVVVAQVEHMSTKDGLDMCVGPIFHYSKL